MSPFGRPPLPPKCMTYFVNGPIDSRYILTYLGKSMAGIHKGNQNAQFELIIHDIPSYDNDKLLFPYLSFLIDNTIIAPTCQISII